MSFHQNGVSQQLLEKFALTRKYSLDLCEHLSDEDLQSQSMPDASPLKWHLAHTTWAFETFVLKALDNNYQVFDKHYGYLFNSYYNAIGEQYPRASRGLLTRPSRQQITLYRHHVDRAMTEFIQRVTSTTEAELHSESAAIIELCINHEQQHQELMLTDLKHLFSFNPTAPVYHKASTLNLPSLNQCQNADMLNFDEGLYQIGCQQNGFHFDNESPVHNYYLKSFKLAPYLVSNGDYLAFIEDGGYCNASLWLSEAWQKINLNNSRHPIYWRQNNQQWFEYGLNGLQPLMLSQPVKHVSFFEACAFANWQGKRLPTEQEWEVAANSQPKLLKQMFNQLWQWTSSSYNAYPGFKPAHGAIGEYNGKFMVNQYVLRGGSVVTPADHIRPSYRNFFYPDARWQYSGIRLAE